MGWGTSAVRYRASADFRQRRWAWLGVAAVIGLAAGVVLALAAGARRADTAVERLLDEADAPETFVISGIPGVFDFAEVDLDEVTALPGVTDSVQVRFLAAAGRTEDGVLVDAGRANFGVDATGRIGRAFNRFKYLEGRPVDPEDPTEVVAGFRVAEAFDLEVGSTIDTRFLDPEEVGLAFTPPDQGGRTFEQFADEGPTDRLHVVGIVAEAGALGTPTSDDTASLWLSPAAADRYAAVFAVEGAYIDLADGPAGEPAFLDRIEGLGGAQPVLTESVAEDAREADRSITPVVRALHLAAVLLGLVTAFLAGQVLSRQAAAEAGDDPALRSVGMTARQLVRLRVVKAAIIAAVAAPTAVLTAILLSPLFPLGLARIVEPDPGVSADVAVLAVGVVALATVVVGLAGAVGWAAVRRQGPAPTTRPSRIVTAAVGAGAPPSVVAGAGLAGQAGRGATARTAGPTVVLGLATVVAVLAFMASLGHLTATPRLFGWTWDVQLGQSFTPAFTDEDIAFLRDDVDVVAAAVGTIATLELGEERVGTLAVDDLIGTVEPALLAGRPAEDIGEVVVAPDLGGIGGTVVARFGDEAVDLEVVGHAVLPGAAAMITFETLRRLTPDVTRQVALVELADDADVEAFIDRTRQPPFSMTDPDIAGPELPPDLVNFGRVDAAPVVVAVAMGVVAAATLLHLLFTTIRRRRRDLAVLRALGFTHRQAATSVVCLALLLIGTATVVAVPIGIAVGRWSWFLFTDELEVVGQAVVPVVAVVLATGVTVVLAVAAALAAGGRGGVRATRLALRAE